MNYYQFNIGDYRRDTTHLSMLEHGAYRQLLDWFYLDEQPIPRETEVVFRRLSARTEEEQKAIQIVLNEMFLLTDAGYTHTRCMQEITAYQGKAERARQAGKLGGRPKKTEEVISGLAKETEEKANHKPLTINQEPFKDNKPAARVSVIFPEPVSEKVKQDFLAIRKAKRAPLTQTALDGIVKEASKAGLSLQAALEMCCSRGWQGFEASWLKDQLGTPQKSAPSRTPTPDNFAAKDYGTGVNPL